MISKVTVNDFQSIEQAELDLGGQGSITTIVGPSSTGKSALLRAMNLLMRNSSSVPVRAQSKKGAVKISAEVDDKTVAVLRGKSLSTYKIDDIEYSKSGVTVPDKVQEVLNLYSASPDLHFSFQFDKPYLLDETGSTISATLGSLTQAHILRNASKEGNRRALETRRLITTRQTDVSSLKEKIETEFSTLEQDRKDYEQAVEAHQKATDASLRASKVSEGLAGVHDAERASQALTDVPVRDASSTLDRAGQALQILDTIVTQLKNITEAKSAFQSLPVSKDASHEINEVVRLIPLLEELLKCVSNLKDSAQTFNVRKISYTQALDGLEVASEQVRVLESQLPRCETCGQVLHDE